MRHARLFVLIGATAAIAVQLAAAAAKERPAKKETDVTHLAEFEVETNGHRHMQDITDAVARVVSKCGVKTGVAHVFNIGSTAAVGTIEFESGLERDLPELLDRLIPPSRQYGHEQAWHDGNGHSHLQATWLGPSISVPVANGKLVLGTWQQIFHLECDGKPRQRRIVVTVIGD